jgi:hypothetical protein
MAENVAESKSEAPVVPPNGAATQAPLVPPQAFQISREDVLGILMLNEREQRVNAELATLRAEGTLQRVLLSQKYGVDFTQYTVDVNQGIATRNPTK